MSTDTAQISDVTEVVEQTQAYYDGPADEIYRRLWRDNIHMGTWREPDDTIDVAMERTNRLMAERGGVGRDSDVLDLGSGYGATARFLAREYGCTVHCLNISPRENALAEQRVRDAGLDDRVTVRYGDFHDIPIDDASFDVVWTQEALLHGADKPRILREAHRVLRPGGRLVLSDLLVRAHLDQSERERIYERVRSPGMWDLHEYVEALEDIGFAIEATADWPENVAPTYESVLSQLREGREALADRVPPEQIERTMSALALWIDAAKAGKISHGFVVARRPSA